MNGVGGSAVREIFEDGVGAAGSDFGEIRHRGAS
jgi:hypothetical protein